jgi:hypothetical protein
MIVVVAGFHVSVVATVLFNVLEVLAANPVDP